MYPSSKHSLEPDIVQVIYGRLLSLFPFSFAGSYKADDILVPARDGALYGTIAGDQHGAGGIYRVAPGTNPTVARVWTFEGGACSIGQKYGRKDGARSIVLGKAVGSIFDAVISPAAATTLVFPSCQVNHLDLVAASDGNLYGATQVAGDDDREGFLYRVIPGERPRAEILFPYNGKNGGAWAPGPLVAARDGKLYGTMMAGGPHGLGTVFVIKPGPKPSMTTLLSIESAEFRKASLRIASRDGRIYGTSGGGAKDCGSAFVLTLGAASRIATLLSFTSERMGDDCKYSGAEATLVAGGDGALYGALIPTGWFGDDSDALGGIVRITTGATPSAARILSFPHQFGYAAGSAGAFMPPLVAANDGNLYGTTVKGGTYGDGSIFRLAPKSSKLETVFSFDAQIRLEPRSALVAGADDNLYGAAGTCCASEGLAFKVQTGTDAQARAFYSFHSGSGAGGPEGALVAGKDGYLYGRTPSGGSSHLGSVYRVEPGTAATVSSLFEFNLASGAKPGSLLIADRNGRFYGTTEEGGAFGMGTIFMVTPGVANPVSVLYSYDETTGRPGQSGLILGADGRLYGATDQSKNGCGTIYRLAPDTPGHVEYPAHL